MLCPNCGSEQASSSAFCRGCGAALGVAVNPPVVQRRSLCPSCGRQVEGQPTFCPYCGNYIGAKVRKKASWAWWLLPIFFTWLGGIIAFIVLLVKGEPGKAILMLICGIVMSIVWVVVWTVVFVILASMSSASTGY